MRTNPFSDVIAFLFQPSWTTAVFWLLLVTSISVAVYTFKRDQSQRAVTHVWNWLARLVMGAMWWQQSLWKLPPTYTDQPDGTGGLHYWIGEMAKYAAFDFHRNFVRNVVEPHFYFFAPQVYSVEVLIAISLIVGLFSRVGALLGALMAANLWLGLYRAPYEWPWTYFFLMVIQITFVVYPPGRSLGIDVLLTRRKSGKITATWRESVLKIAA
jgi:uncharacterized membrane protein YphA (DoxX/SURF4 family)